MISRGSPVPILDGKQLLSPSNDVIFGGVFGGVTVRGGS